MIENQLDLPKLEDRFVDIYQSKCINDIPISFFNKDKLHLVDDLDQDLIKYTYFLYRNIFFNILHSSEVTQSHSDSSLSERRIFTSEFTNIENRLFKNLKEPYINVRNKLNNRSEMSHFFNEFLEQTLLKYNVIHVINKDIYNLMKYVYFGYRGSSETNNMDLLIPIDNKNITINIDSNRSYNLTENFFGMSHYWRMIHLFDRSKEDKDFFISLVLNTYINRNYSSTIENNNYQSKISIVEFIMLNYIKNKNVSLKRNTFLEIFFDKYVKKISSETQIVDHGVLKLFLLHNKNEKNISYQVNKILEDISNKYPVFNFNVSTEAEEDELVLDDEPDDDQDDSIAQTNKNDKEAVDLILKDEPEEGDDNDSDLEDIPELGDDENIDTSTDDDTVPEETDPVDENLETGIQETEDELSGKDFLTKRKIFTLNEEFKNKQINNSDFNILNQWCRKNLWGTKVEQSLYLLKRLKIKLP